ncbi:hypothetical protein CI109_106086 [Kwoniella shandongensis]|uniref:Uncharacterized protein n=1 Tax=Kwoniella shandongensis TaxID=1734106 RepID=A0A5M6BUT8_9TREE|nr:uncharacterized protein CI109_006376 [Kwoniella shandongensis]KAA5525305.1 hypothetical protein CI109_006376 [Kwoniella shandongensis]
MARGGKHQPPPSSPTSNDSWNDDSQEDIGALLKDVKQKIHAEHKRLTQSTLAEANKYAENVKGRIEHAINVTHREELNTIHADLLASLNEQDLLLTKAHDELLLVDQEISSAISSFWKGWKEKMEGNVKMGKGCEMTMEQSLKDEEQSTQVLALAVGIDLDAGRKITNGDKAGSGNEIDVEVE